MKKVGLITLLLVLGFGAYWFFLRGGTKHRGPKQAAIVLKKHSDDFNRKVDAFIATYLDLKDAFVNDDTLSAKKHVALLIQAADSIPVVELKKDTAGIFETVQMTLNDIKANAASLQSQSSLSEMRKDFKSLTDVMYPMFFKSINYEGNKLFLQHCPMAFGDEQGADWISRSEEIMNPYLGRNHPEYKAGMLHCGEVKDTIKAP